MGARLTRSCQLRVGPRGIGGAADYMAGDRRARPRAAIRRSRDPRKVVWSGHGRASIYVCHQRPSVSRRRGVHRSPPPAPPFAADAEAPVRMRVAIAKSEDPSRISSSSTCSNGTSGRSSARRSCPWSARPGCGRPRLIAAINPATARNVGPRQRRSARDRRCLDGEGAHAASRRDGRSPTVPNSRSMISKRVGRHSRGVVEAALGGCATPGHIAGSSFGAIADRIRAPLGRRIRMRWSARALAYSHK